LPSASDPKLVPDERSKRRFGNLPMEIKEKVGELHKRQWLLYAISRTIVYMFTFDEDLI
jgi:hypothetical protein